MNHIGYQVFSIKRIYIKKYMKNYIMFRITFTSSYPMNLSVFNSSFVDSILKIQNINYSEPF